MGGGPAGTQVWDASVVFHVIEDGIELTDEVRHVRVRLRDGHRPWSDEIFDFNADLLHDSLTAASGVRTIQGDGLVEWLTELAEPFSGWSGRRSWESLDRDLTIHASHDGRRHVTLIFAARGPVGYRADAWEATVATALDAGEDMRNFANEVRAFLA
jgi:hypothetical protein